MATDLEEALAEARDETRHRRITEGVHFGGEPYDHRASGADVPCRCAEKGTDRRVAWSCVFGDRPRRVYWYCWGCKSMGLLLFPMESPWFSPDYYDPKVEGVVDSLLAGEDDPTEGTAWVSYLWHAAEETLTRRGARSTISAQWLAEVVPDRVLCRLLGQIRRKIQEVSAEVDRRAIAVEARRVALEKDAERQRDRLESRFRRHRKVPKVSPKAGGRYPVLVRGSERLWAVIYGLVDTRAPERVRYVGRSTNHLGRYASHLGEAGAASAKGAWIGKVLEEGATIDMVLLEAVPAGVDVLECESAWIHALRARGEADLNTALPAPPQPTEGD